jgi:hypothetical protein
MATTFTITGQRQLQARLTAIGKAPPIILREAGVRGVGFAKKRVRRKTGNLGRTIRMGTVTDTYVEIKAGGQLNVGYAGAIERGARPHVIRPRKAKVLAWGGSRTLGGRLRAGGRATNFAMVVHHPGNPAYPFLAPGLFEAIEFVGLGPVVEEWNEAA